MEDEKRGPGRPKKVIVAMQEETPIEAVEPVEIEPEEAAEPTVRAVVLRDFWPTENDEDRVRAGSIIEVSKDALIDGLEKGILARAPVAV